MKRIAIRRSVTKLLSRKREKLESRGNLPTAKFGNQPPYSFGQGGGVIKLKVITMLKL